MTEPPDNPDNERDRLAREVRDREVARLTRSDREGWLLERRRYRWPELHAWPDHRSTLCAYQRVRRPGRLSALLARHIAETDAVYALYVSRGTEATARLAVARQLLAEWKTHDPRWLREAVAARARAHGQSIETAKVAALDRALAVLFDADREQTVRWGCDEWMYDGDGRRARVVWP